MNRHAVSHLTLKALDEEQRLLEGWASRPEVDRVGDIVESRGASFRLPLPLLMDHNHSAAVGDVIEAKVSDAGIRFKAKIAKIAEPGTIKDLCDSAWAAAKAGLRRAVSIGFRPLEMEPLQTGGMRFTAWEWFELSLVSVPACAGATIDQVKAIDRELIRKAGRSRVVRLDNAPRTHRVVKLGPSVAPARSVTTATPIGDAVRRVVDKVESDLDLYEAIKSVGPKAYLELAHREAIEMATEGEFATVRARLAALEGKR